MSKALRNMSNTERVGAINRRLQERTGGLGYWAAIDDALYRLALKQAQEKAKKVASG